MEFAMTKTSRTFHFGGDHSTTSHWIARVPVFINNSFGYVQAFIIAGETPMLLGRPIIESLGIVINFKRQQMMFEGHDWRQIIVGRHGEYLLSLTEDFDAELASQPPSFDLKLDDQSQASDGSTSQPSQVLDFQTYQQQEKVFLGSDAPQCVPGERNVLNKHRKMFENALVTEEKRVHATVTRELNDPEVKPRVIWEVYAGESRMSQIAETLGCHVESFGYETGWDFDLPSHRKAFMMRLSMENARRGLFGSSLWTLESHASNQMRPLLRRRNPSSSSEMTTTGIISSLSKRSTSPKFMAVDKPTLNSLMEHFLG